MNAPDLAETLISYNTESPVVSDKPLKPIESLLDIHGIEHDIHQLNGVKNLTAEFGDAPPCICFNGHLDVVEAEGVWQVTEPFEPLIKEGTLYGRGASDMKAALAAEVCAFIDLYESETFDGRAVLMVVGDEEIGGNNGTGKLVERYPDVDYAIVGEPTDLNIQVATRGILWVDVYLKGEGIHVTRKHQTENIINQLPEVLHTLSDLKLTYESDDILPDPENEITIVRTDDTQNSLPEEAWIGLDIRYVPSQTVPEIIQQIHNILNPRDIEYGLKKTDHGGPYKLTDKRFRRIATEIITEVRGEQVEHITEGGASDGRFFAEHGTPFIELGVNQEWAHQTDERCEVSNLKLLRDGYARIANRLASNS